jgi:hypothetical protein
MEERRKAFAARYSGDSSKTEEKPQHYTIPNDKEKQEEEVIEFVPSGNKINVVADYGSQASGYSWEGVMLTVEEYYRMIGSGYSPLEGEVAGEGPIPLVAPVVKEVSPKVSFADAVRSNEPVKNDDVTPDSSEVKGKNVVNVAQKGSSNGARAKTSDIPVALSFYKPTPGTDDEVASRNRDVMRKVINHLEKGGKVVVLITVASLPLLSKWDNDTGGKVAYGGTWSRVCAPPDKSRFGQACESAISFVVLNTTEGLEHLIANGVMVLGTSLSRNYVEGHRKRGEVSSSLYNMRAWENALVGSVPINLRIIEVLIRKYVGAVGEKARVARQDEGRSKPSSKSEGQGDSNRGRRTGKKRRPGQSD